MPRQRIVSKKVSIIDQSVRVRIRRPIDEKETHNGTCRYSLSPLQRRNTFYHGFERANPDENANTTYDGDVKVRTQSSSNNVSVVSVEEIVREKRRMYNTQ